MIHLILALLAIITLITCFLKLAKHIHEKTFTYTDFFHIALTAIPLILIFIFQFGDALYNIIDKEIFLLLAFLCGLMGICVSSGYFMTLMTTGAEYKLTKKVFVIVGSFTALAFIFILIGFN